MTFCLDRILLIAFIIGWPVTISLRCYLNSCDEEKCNFEGPGIHHYCGEYSEEYTYYCFDQHFAGDSERLHSSGCVATPDKNTEKISGCGAAIKQMTSSTDSCICYEDLCNNHFKSSDKFISHVDQNGEIGDFAEGYPKE